MQTTRPGSQQVGETGVGWDKFWLGQCLSVPNESPDGENNDVFGEQVTTAFIGATRIIDVRFASVISPFLFSPLSGVRCCLQLFSPPHLLVFSTIVCLLSSSSSLPPLLSSSHLSLHSPSISALASLVSSCHAHVILPLSSVVCRHPVIRHPLYVSSPL